MSVKRRHFALRVLLCNSGLKGRKASSEVWSVFAWSAWRLAHCNLSVANGMRQHLIQALAAVRDQRVLVHCCHLSIWQEKAHVNRGSREVQIAHGSMYIDETRPPPLWSVTSVGLQRAELQIEWQSTREVRKSVLTRIYIVTFRHASSP